MKRHPIPLLAALAIAVATAGCGVDDPYAANTTTTRRPPPPSRDTPPPASRPSTTPPPAGRASKRRTAPERTAAAYAAAQGNYTPANYRRQHRAMAALSAGPLRRELTRTPVAVIAQGIRESGTQAATTVLATARDPRRGKSQIVTVALRQLLATTSEAGRPGPEYLYYRATLTHTHTGWRVVQFALTQ